jgi:hypothetical protein
MGNLDVKTLEQMDTPKLVFYEHSFEDPIKTSLTKSVLNLGIECRALAEENARLKTEVERLTAFTTRTIIPNEVLQAEVERLKRSGDLMLKFACANMPYPPYVTMAKDWNAAKEDLEHLRNLK